MSDEEINLADPVHGASLVILYDGHQLTPQIKQLHEYWSHDIDLSTARWLWIKFAKPSWIMSVRVNFPSIESYPTDISAFYSTDNGHQIISLFQERKIMLGKDDRFVERGIAPVSSDNIVLFFSHFNHPDKSYLPDLKDIQVMGMFEE